MANKKKCGYAPCHCTVPEHEYDCSHHCKNSPKKEIDVPCDRKHEPCVLTFELAQGSMSTQVRTPSTWNVIGDRLYTIVESSTYFEGNWS
jgi:hypothetical protein